MSISISICQCHYQLGKKDGKLIQKAFEALNKKGWISRLSTNLIPNGNKAILFGYNHSDRNYLHLYKIKSTR